MKTKIMFTATILAATSVGASAQSMDSMSAASNLGSILAAESFCGLRYDQTAITNWIDQNTRPDDMSFASMLSMMTDGATYELQSMGQSQRTAHCHSVERTARHYGFID